MQVQDMIHKEYIIYSSVNKMSRDMSIKVIFCSDFYNSLCIELGRVINKLRHIEINRSIIINVTDLDIAQMLEEHLEGLPFIDKTGHLMVQVRFYPKGSIYFDNPQDFVIAVLEDSCGYAVTYDSRVTLEYLATYFVNNDFGEVLFDSINANYPFKPIYKKYLI